MINQKKIAKRERIRSYLSLDHRSHLDAPQIVERLPETDIANVQKIVASQIELLAVYHNLVLDQARRTFKWALFFSIIGIAFFLTGIGFTFYLQSQLSAVSLISGIFLEIISGINFYSYGKSSEYLANYQDRLDSTQRFLLANSLAESLDGDYKQQARAGIVKAILGDVSIE